MAIYELCIFLRTIYCEGFISFSEDNKCRGCVRHVYIYNILTLYTYMNYRKNRTWKKLVKSRLSGVCESLENNKYRGNDNKYRGK